MFDELKENLFQTSGPLPWIEVGFLKIPTYYFIISLTCCVCILWFYRRCRFFNLSQKKGMDIVLVLLITGFVGARLAHIFFENPSHYLFHPLDVFYFWQGGFVFYGGAFLSYLSVVFFIKKLKLDFWIWHDVLTPVLALGYALGRLACFFAGCCYGKICTLPWALPLKQMDLQNGKVEVFLRHPTALYASVLEFSALFFLLWFETKKPKPGQVFLIWVLCHSVNRLIMEIFRADPRGPQPYGISLSMAVSFILFFISVFLLIKIRFGFSRNFSRKKA